MQQVPADRVIAEMASRMGDLARENAILKVQVDLYREQAAAMPPSEPVTQTMPVVPGIPTTVPAPDLTN